MASPGPRSGATAGTPSPTARGAGQAAAGGSGPDDEAAQARAKATLEKNRRFYRKLFDFYDEDHSGTIDVDELVGGLSRRGREAGG